MTSNPERAAMLAQAYDAFNRRAIDAVLSMLDTDVEWPNVAEQTTLHGHDAVRQYWERQFQQIDSHVEPTEYLPHDGALIVAVHQVVRDRQGNLLSDANIAHAYTFRNGLVLRMQVYPTVDDAASQPPSQSPP
ncbi:MAG: nuclear transport factor 2 family protein [Dehalococcoidia bacterium]